MTSTGFFYNGALGLLKQCLLYSKCIMQVNIWSATIPNQPRLFPTFLAHLTFSPVLDLQGHKFFLKPYHYLHHWLLLCPLVLSILQNDEVDDMCHAKGTRHLIKTALSEVNVSSLS